MTIEIHKPEIERMVQEEILSGHFANVDDLLMEALQALRERKAIPSPQSSETGMRDTLERPIWETINERMRKVPDEVFERLPRDGASEHDHYLYGSPKHNQ
jgi:Arc/MetJ-type ribon-helix-helix transcriptional regulator